MNLSEFIKNNESVNNTKDIDLFKDLKALVISFGDIEHIYLVNDQITNYLPIIECLLRISKIHNYFYSLFIQTYIENFSLSANYSENDFMTMKYLLEDHSSELVIYLTPFDGKFL